MRITKSQLQKIIKEEIQKVTKEGMLGDFFSDEESGLEIGPDSAVKEFAEQQQENWSGMAHAKVVLFKRKMMDFLKGRNPSMWNVHKKQAQRIAQSLESAVKVSSSGGKVMVSIAPGGKGGIGQNWLKMDIEATVEVPKDSDGKAVYLGFYINTQSTGGDQGHAWTRGERLYPDDLHIQIEDLLRQASLRSVGRSFPEAKDVQGEGSGYIAMIPIPEGSDVYGTTFAVLQQLFKPLGRILGTLLELNAYPWIVSFESGNDTGAWRTIQQQAFSEIRSVFRVLKS